MLSSHGLYCKYLYLLTLSFLLSSHCWIFLHYILLSSSFPFHAFDSPIQTSHRLSFFFFSLSSTVCNTPIWIFSFLRNMFPQHCRHLHNRLAFFVSFYISDISSTFSITPCLSPFGFKFLICFLIELSDPI